MSSPRPLVAGNWKMNGLRAQLTEIAAIRDGVAQGAAGRAETLICPPATFVAAAATLCEGSPLKIGGQDAHQNKNGAHTGDISAQMLQDLGASYVILGHSERRADHAESSALVRAKTAAAIEAGLTAIVCVGETRAEREAGKTAAIVSTQLEESLDAAFAAERLVVAYEPVWAIGTGLTPTPQDVAETHALIRGLLEKKFGAKGKNIRILYGGSVKPSNAAELMAVENVNGALIGGASLKAVDFLAIARVYV